MKRIHLCFFLGLLISRFAYAEAEHGVGNEAQFAQWLQTFSAEAVAAGVREQTVRQAMQGLEYNPKVVRLDRNQPEFTQTLDTYLDKRITGLQVKRGKRRIAKNASLLNRVAKTYGVDAYMVAAIWGVESNFGTYLPRFDALQSLATLAFDARRSAYFQSELLAALQILDKNDLQRSSLKGSYAGALGQPQFMPSTYLLIAQDFDQDGFADIWNSKADVLASIAAYLQKIGGWQPGQPWGTKVSLLEQTDIIALQNRQMSVSKWLQQGVQIPDQYQREWPQQPVTLLIPERSRRQAFLVTSNFMAIMEYNRSHFYALAVCLLADQLR